MPQTSLSDRSSHAADWYAYGSLGFISKKSRPSPDWQNCTTFGLDRSRTLLLRPDHGRCPLLHSQSASQGQAPVPDGTLAPGIETTATRFWISPLVRTTVASARATRPPITYCRRNGPSKWVSPTIGWQQLGTRTTFVGRLASSPSLFGSNGPIPQAASAPCRCINPRVSNRTHIIHSSGSA